ncbi:alpha/beta fold hydrolase [Streptomyces harbinensis]|uniref:alpha/beta fold hydrolase n=1 Tax=Streptomyces harbinensis TaxID=1176198 RepID=UPI0037151821
MSFPYLSHDVAGEGPAVLLLHSSVCDRRMWDPQWRVLIDAGFHLIRPDFRGHGDSPAVPGPHSDAEDVRDLLDELNVDRVAVVGSSFGGRVALEFAARWPERVGSLALLCAGSPGHRPSAVLTAFSDKEDQLIAADDIAGAVELNVSTWLGPDADGNTRAMVRLMQRRAFDVQLAAEESGAQPSAAEPVRLSRIGAVPVLAVSGAHDFPDFREIAASLPHELPNARHLELPWAGHLPSLERPAEVAGLLAGFLRDQR